MQVASRRFSQAIDDVEETPPVLTSLSLLSDLLRESKSVIPKVTYDRAISAVTSAMKAESASEKVRSAEIGLLGVLATAGIWSLAFTHDTAAQLQKIEAIGLELARMAESEVSDTSTRLAEIADSVAAWVKNTKDSREMFSTLLVEKNRIRGKVRLKASRTVQLVVEQVSHLDRGVLISQNIDPRVSLPVASFAEWTAILQNVLLNACNATVGAKQRKIVVSSGENRQLSWLTIEDTGIGVDLESAEELFKPFIRSHEIPQDRHDRGLGGGGLGLTIARMVARSIDCEVHFVKPRKGYATAFRVEWTRGS